MEFLSNYGLFLAQAVTIVVAILVVAGSVMSMSMRHKEQSKERLEIKNLNQKFANMANSMRAAMLSKKEFKEIRKQDKHKQKELTKKLKSKDKTKGKKPAKKKQIFVINFHGDIRGSAVSSLREEITAVLTIATPKDEVLLRLESGGGVVHAYGLAASQLSRLREKKVKLTVAVDKVAASGGYLMACVADKIIAAPFAILGSIGVLSQIPNFNRLLKKHDIDFEQFTAGEYKRTVTMFGENTDKAREKHMQDINEVHTLFKDFVKSQRDIVDIDRVATGEHWLGTQALTLKLIDELRTSDDYLLASSNTANIYELSYTAKKPIVEKLSNLASMFFNRSSLASQLERDQQSVVNTNL